MKKLIFLLALICNLTFAICNCSSQWYQVNLPVASTIQKVQFVNPNTGWLVMYNNNLLKSTNGGINWSVIIDTTNHLFEFQFINDTLGYGLGVNGVNNLLLRTTNGGYNWTVMHSSSLFMLSGFYFVNADTGYFNGFVYPTYITYRTTNGFQTYEPVSTGPGGSPAKVYFFKEPVNGMLQGFIQGGGHLWKTTNSGYNWTQLSFSEAGSVNSFSFLNKDTGFVIYYPNIIPNPKILSSSNAGLNWAISYTHNISFGLGYIQAVNQYKIWSGTSSNYLLISTNGGIDWGKQYSPISSNYNVYMYDTSLGFAWSGVQLVRTTNGGGPIVSVNNISVKTPDKFRLSQNYPNPFNHSTIISYQLRVSGFVKIIIYDVTGKESYTAVNERHTAGIYETTFDGSFLSSGVYFYQLTINSPGREQLATKRMVLIK